jgi:hypothetical protein
MRHLFHKCALGAFAAIVLLSAPATVEARQGGNFGAGIIAGNPSGLSGKLWLNETNALDFIAGFSIIDDYMSLNADYVWHEFGLIPVSRGQLPLYYGMGVWTSVSDNPSVGARGIVGLEYLFPSAPLDVFLEIGPSASILPSTGFGIDGGLGMRFFF